MPREPTLLSSVEVFVRVVELSSFRRAAAALSLTPSAVSRSIARLEARTEVRLLRRTTRSLEVTDEGRAFFDHARRALDELDAANLRLRSAREGLSGVVRVEAPPFLADAFIAPALPALLARHPRLSVHLSVRHPPRDPGEDGIDLAVRISLPRNQAKVVRRVGQLTAKVVLCASPAYLARAGRPRTLDELERHACLGFLSGDHVEPWEHVVEGRTVRRAVRGPLAVGTKALLIQAAVAGVGISRVAEHMIARELEAGLLERVLAGFEVVEQVPLFLVAAHHRGWLPRRLRTVWDFLAEHLATPPG
jgi:DNA-binding transcriptional LysR family regulator